MRALVILFFSFSIFFSWAQEKTWYNNNWKKVSQSEAAYYIPTPKKVKNGYWIVKYYKNGQKFTEGFSTDSKITNEAYEGVVNYYNANGSIAKKESYRNGELNGLKKVYFSTGELKSVGRYRNGKEDGVWKTFYKNGKIKTRGKYKKGEKVGVWKTFYKNIY